MANRNKEFPTKAHMHLSAPVVLSKGRTGKSCSNQKFAAIGSQGEDWFPSAKEQLCVIRKSISPVKASSANFHWSLHKLSWKKSNFHYPKRISSVFEIIITTWVRWWDCKIHSSFTKTTKSCLRRFLYLAFRHYLKVSIYLPPGWEAPTISTQGWIGNCWRPVWVV